MELLLDGKIIVDKQILFIELKKQVNSPEFYGDNLDALWDVLSYSDEHIKITIINHEDLITNLGKYQESLIELFEDLKDVNDNVSIDIK